MPAAYETAAVCAGPAFRTFYRQGQIPVGMRLHFIPYLDRDLMCLAGVNTSEAFAREVDNIPVIGALARILTFRSYEVWTEDLKISVEIPGVEVIAEELAGLEKEVNEDIYSFCQRI